MRTMNEYDGGWTVRRYRSQFVSSAPVHPVAFGAITAPLQVVSRLDAETVPEPGVAAFEERSGTSSASNAATSASAASAARARGRRGRRCVTSCLPVAVDRLIDEPL